VLDESGTDVDHARAGHTAAVAVRLAPRLVDRSGLRAAIGAAEHDDLALVAVGLEEVAHVLLCAPRLGEDDRFPGGAHLLHLAETDLQGAQERRRLGVDGDPARPFDEAVEFGDLSVERGKRSLDIFGQHAARAVARFRHHISALLGLGLIRVGHQFLVEVVLFEVLEYRELGEDVVR